MKDYQQIAQFLSISEFAARINVPAITPLGQQWLASATPQISDRDTFLHRRTGPRLSQQIGGAA